MQCLAKWRKGLAMASIQLLVRLMGVGGNGVAGHTASCNMGSALGKKGVRGNVTTQNLNMAGRIVKEVEQKQTVAQRQKNVLWIAIAKNGQAGSPVPSHVPTVPLLNAPM